MDETLQAAYTYIRDIAKRSGVALNPSERKLERLVAQLAQTFEQAGSYYCPCKRSYPLDPLNDEVCPCADFEEDVQRLGRCDCGLFFSIATEVQAKRRPGLLATITCPG